MFYKIQKSLGNVSAVSTENIPVLGICVEFKNYGKRDASIVVYQDGKPQDISLNGWTFPCVFNHVEYTLHDDIYGGHATHSIDFEFLDPSGSVQNISKKSLYGSRESLTVEYFFTLLYNISCCSDIEQYKNLYKYIIDNECFSRDRNRKDAINVLNFIESFSSQLEKVEDKEYLAGLKLKINVKFKIAQEIIASASCPE